MSTYGQSVGRIMRGMQTRFLFSDGLRLIHLYNIKRHHNSIRLDILEQSRCYLLKNKGRLKTDNAAFSDGLFI